MAKKLNPYYLHTDTYENSSRPLYSLTTSMGLRKDQVDPVYVTQDGKIIANGFVDKNDDLELYLKNNNEIAYKVRSAEGVSSIHSVSTVENYTATGSSFTSHDGDFFKYSQPLDVRLSSEREKYLRLNKKTRNLISQSASPFLFHFTHESGTKYPLPHIESSWVPTFNVDVSLMPSNFLANTTDLIVIKSGEYDTKAAEPANTLISNLYYSTGTNGNIYIDTLSIPTGFFRGKNPANDSLKTFKIPRTGNSNYATDGTEANAGGPIGVFKNGVVAFGYNSTNNYSGNYNENSFVANSFYKDSNNGFTALASDIVSGNTPVDTYHYKSAPFHLYDTGSTAHSPLLGYAFDGSPIYGPYGYTSALDSSSTPKIMAPSWRLKELSSRTAGPDYNSTYPSGYFVEDYEFVSGLGDLDRHNGRNCVTPEYPGGVYAYFTTVDSSHEPAFPYIVGDKFYKKVEKQNWSGVTFTEAIQAVTGQALPANSTDIDLFDDSIYGLVYRDKVGLKSETILWVSPHEMSSLTGAYLETGTIQLLNATGGNATFSGNLFSAGGNTVASGHTNRYIVGSSSFSYPTSKNYQFVNNQPFSGGMTYIRKDPDTLTEQEATGYLNLKDTNFYQIYSGYKNGIEGVKANAKNPVFFTGQWNGVIPSGTPIKIEIWSFNGQLNGILDGISVVPTNGHDSVTNKSVFFEGVFTGEGGSYEEARKNMTINADKHFRRQMNNYLIKSGVINPSRNIYRYKWLLQDKASS